MKAQKVERWITLSMKQFFLEFQNLLDGRHRLSWIFYICVKTSNGFVLCWWCKNAKCKAHKESLRNFILFHFNFILHFHFYSQKPQNISSFSCCSNNFQSQTNRQFTSFLSFILFSGKNPDKTRVWSSYYQKKKRHQKLVQRNLSSSISCDNLPSMLLINDKTNKKKQFAAHVAFKLLKQY